MKRYAIYDTTTGTILRVVQCAPAMAALQAKAGEATLECGADVLDTTHRVEGGVIVPIG